MSKQTLGIRILISLYRAASRASSLTEARLSNLTAIEPEMLDELLTELDAEGYLHRAQLRLTLEGLTVAVAASKKQSRRFVAKAA